MATKSAILDGDKALRLLIAQITDYAIFLLTPTGEVSSWNRGAEQLKGYKANEIIGRHFRIFYPPQDQAERKPERELEVAAATGRFEDEGWRIRKDGSRFWANVIITTIREHGEILGYGKVTRDLTERKNAEEQLSELSGRVLNMQDEERRRLGIELHDAVGQYLAAAKMSLDGLAAEERFQDQQTHKQIADCIKNIDGVIREVRTLSYLLYPPMLEEVGLSSAIRWHLDGFSGRSGIQTTCEIPDDAKRLPREVELALFRVFQESLTNIHRHSKSKTAHIRFAINASHALLEIRDQGTGLTPNIPKLESNPLGTLGVGIRGMQERVRQLAGSLEINSTQEGTTVKVSIPLNVAPSTR